MADVGHVGEGHPVCVVSEGPPELGDLVVGNHDEDGLAGDQPLLNEGKRAVQKAAAPA